MSKIEEFNSIFCINKDGTEFIKERLNIKDRILVVGLEKNDDFNNMLSKYECFYENKSYDFLNNFSKKGKSFKEICFLGDATKELKEVSTIREISEKAYEHLGVNGYLILQIINYDKFIVCKEREEIFPNNEVIYPMWKEDVDSILKSIGFVDIDFYGDFTKDKFDDINSNSMIIRARKYVDLLKDTPDYEEYGENIVKAKSCGGCSCKKSGNSSGCTGCSKRYGH